MGRADVDSILIRRIVLILLLGGIENMELVINHLFIGPVLNLGLFHYMIQRGRNFATVKERT